MTAWTKSVGLQGKILQGGIRLLTSLFLLFKIDTTSFSSPVNDSYYDNLSAKQCHGKGLPCSVNDTSLCISQEDVSRFYPPPTYSSL